MQCAPNDKRVKLRFLLFLLLLLALSAPITAKGYKIVKININAQLRIDGSMDVVESRVLQFKEAYKNAIFVLTDTGSVVLHNFKISENNHFYVKSDSKEPGTFKITDKKGRIELEWFFQARNETKTFHIHYQVENAIKRYDDAAILHFQFISQERTKAANTISLNLKPPAPLSKDQLSQWLHGPLWYESWIENDGTIAARCEYLPKQTYLELRALYPPEIFPQAKKISGNVRTQIVMEETGVFKEVDHQREIARQKQLVTQKRWAWGLWLVIAVSIGALLVWCNIFRIYGKRPARPAPVPPTSEVPAKSAPVLVGYLLYNRKIFGNTLVATLLDLARRGFLTLREDRIAKKKVLGGSRGKTQYSLELKRDFWQQNKLVQYEEELLAFIFDELAKGRNVIDLKAIQEQQSKFTNFFRQWTKDVKKYGEDQGWYVPHSIRGRHYSTWLSGVVALLTMLFYVLFGPWAAISGIVAIIIFFLSFIIPHRTRESQVQVLQWKALRKYLRKYQYRDLDSTEILEKIDDYFVYGVILGLGKKVYRELAGYIPESSYTRYLSWYKCYGDGNGTFTPKNFARAFSSMIATIILAMATATGTGRRQAIDREIIDEEQ